MRRTAALLVMTALALGLTGCAGTPGEPSTSAATGTNRPATDEAEPEPDPVETTPAPAAVNPKLGSPDGYTWEDGLTVTVTAAAPYKPSEYGGIDPAPAAYVAFNVTIVNGTTANFDPSSFSTSLQSANAEAEELYDSEGGLSGSPSTTLLPGREVAFKIGYGVADPKDLVLELSPDYDHEDAIFTS